MGNQQSITSVVTKSALGSKYKSNARLTKTVIRCQAYIRGYLARKNYKKIKTEHKFRRTIMTEIVTTERAYLQHLQTMIKNYMEPLSDHSSCLTREEVEGIFSRNLPIIINLHTDILKQIEDRLASWRYSSTVGDIFTYISPYLKCHSDYVNQYGKSITMLSNAQKTRDQGLMDLPSYLIMPVQRVPRYELLLREMLKFTPKTHPDHALVEKALEQVKKVASAINEKNREAESLNKMLDIQQSHPNIEILAAHRRYVRHGEFEQASRSSQLWRSTRILYLCNDSIIICFPRALNQDDIVIVSFESFAIFPVMSADATPVVRQVELYSPEISTYMGNAKSSLILETKENIAEWYDLVNVTARSWISNSYKIRGLSDCDSISDSNGNTAVHIAAINGKIEIVQYLLDQGVSPNILNSAGQTPLHLSIRKKSIPCVVCCVERGAYINLPDRNGKTPLMHSFETKNEKISLYLSDNGARLISPQHIPEDLRVYLEKAIKTSADRYSSMNMLNHQRLQKKQRGEMSLCYLCATTPRLLKVYCFKCQALCCQKCSAKKMARPDQPRVVGQICDSCFNILTKHQTDSGSFSGAVPV